MLKSIDKAELLSVKGVTVRFPGVLALNNVSFSVKEGEVLGLMGENGAGKSTLLKVLSGVNKPTSGEIAIRGKQLSSEGEKAALDAGIAIIYQELHLVPNLSVAENLMLGHWPNRFGVVDQKKLVATALKELERLGEQFDPSTKVRDLSIGQRQMVEIGKALLRNASVIAFDEPTSSLSAKETDRLMEIIKALRQQGRGIIYVTHRMEEMYRICDRVTVFRDGAHVQTFDDVAQTDQAEIISAMVGRSITDMYRYRPRATGKALLRAEQLMGPGLAAPATFSLHSGEIIGIFGLVGAGRSELMRLIYGAEKPNSGQITVDDAPIRAKAPLDAINAGLGFCPEDRKAQGIIPNASVNDNLNISCRPNIARWRLLLDRAKEQTNSAEYIKKLGIKTPSAQARIANLSGGNQQKVILARWMASDTKVFLLDEPTRGIDVGAKSEIYELLYQMGEAGKGVVVVSSDLAEVIGVSDRILVMNAGRLVGEVPRSEATPEVLMRMALPTA